MTIISSFGVTARPSLPGPLGRAGPWAPAVAEIEALYGPDQVVHLSLEEFGRNLPAAQAEAERWREGGRSLREIRRLRASRRWGPSVARMRRLYRRYRALDVPNLLHLIPTFRGSRAFRRDYPEMLECGPLAAPPPPGPRAPGRPTPRGRRTSADWIWYASPATAPQLIPGLLEGTRRAGRPLVLHWRSSRSPPEVDAGGGLRVVIEPRRPRPSWERRFRAAELRIVTGSRSLLEALEIGGPFLYFNGAGGTGAARHPHRPEKLRGLLDAWRRAGVSATLRGDLSDFARVRRVPEIVERALVDPRWSAAFPQRPPPVSFRPPFDRTVTLLGTLAREWAGSSEGAPEFVRRWRVAGNRMPSSSKG